MQSRKRTCVRRNYNSKAGDEVVDSRSIVKGIELEDFRLAVNEVIKRNPPSYRIPRSSSLYVPLSREFTPGENIEITDLPQLKRFLGNVRMEYLKRIYLDFFEDNDSYRSMKKGALVLFLAEIYLGLSPSLHDRQEEERNLDNYDPENMNREFQLFELCGVNVPEDVVMTILNYAIYDSKLLHSLGSVNSKWYLYLLSHWKGMIKISRGGCHEISLLVLQTCRNLCLDFGKGLITMSELKYLVENLSNNGSTIRHLRFSHGSVLTIKVLIRVMKYFAKQKMRFVNCNTLDFGHIYDHTGTSALAKSDSSIDHLFPKLKKLRFCPYIIDYFDFLFPSSSSDQCMFQNLKTLTEFEFMGYRGRRWILGETDKQIEKFYRTENISKLTMDHVKRNCAIEKKDEKRRLEAQLWRHFKNLDSLKISLLELTWPQFGKHEATKRVNLDFSMLQTLKSLELKLKYSKSRIEPDIKVPEKLEIIRVDGFRDERTARCVLKKVYGESPKRRIEEVLVGFRGKSVMFKNLSEGVEDDLVFSVGGTRKMTWKFDSTEYDRLGRSFDRIEAVFRPRVGRLEFDLDCRLYCNWRILEDTEEETKRKKEKDTEMKMKFMDRILAVVMNDSEKALEKIVVRSKRGNDFSSEEEMRNDEDVKDRWEDWNIEGFEKDEESVKVELETPGWWQNVKWRRGKWSYVSPNVRKS